MTEKKFCRKVVSEAQHQLLISENDSCLEDISLRIPFRAKSYQRIANLIDEINRVGFKLNIYIEPCEENEIRVTRLQQCK